MKATAKKLEYGIPTGLPAEVAAKVEFLNRLHAKFKFRECHPKSWKGEMDRHDYWDAQRQVTRVWQFVVRRKRVFDQVDLHKWSYEWYISEVKHKKEYGKKRFETQYQFSPWFMQTSFGSDYGEYTCEDCRRTFYHSPCAIYLAGKEKKNCLCGYCANTYARSNDQSEIYHGREY